MSSTIHLFYHLLSGKLIPNIENNFEFRQFSHCPNSKLFSIFGIKSFCWAIAFLFFLPFCAADEHSYLLFSGTANLPLAEKVAQCLQMKLSPVSITSFNDGEIGIKIEQNVRNAEVYLIQSVCLSGKNTVNDNLIELYLMIRTLRRSSAGKITVVIPYYGYARQDRKTQSRVPISASDVAMLLELAGANHILCVDLHCGQIQGFFHEAIVDNLYAAPIFVRYFAEKNDLTRTVVVSPDAGGVDRAKKFIEGLSWYGIDAGLAVIVKQRAGAGVIEKMNLVGEVDGCDVIIVDDICDTAGTLVNAARELKNQGAHRVFACITHPVFSGPALERIEASCLNELVVMNTIPARTSFPKNIIQLSIAPLIAEAIDRIHHGESISHLFTYGGNLVFCSDRVETPQ
jgi:ribose-phosphate pyrophosphokinase